LGALLPGFSPGFPFERFSFHYEFSLLLAFLIGVVDAGAWPLPTTHTRRGSAHWQQLQLRHQVRPRDAAGPPGSPQRAWILRANRPTPMTPLCDSQLAPARRAVPLTISLVAALALLAIAIATVSVTMHRDLEPLWSPRCHGPAGQRLL
jgi:hypothetical protein